MNQNTFNEIFFSGNRPLRDESKLWKLLGDPKQEIEAMIGMLKASPSRDILVLDAGSGHGAWSKLLFDMGYSVVGVDVSSFHMKNSKQKYREVPFTIGDLLHSPFKKESFNVVLCSGFLHHFPDIKKIIAEIHRVSKGMGHILICEPNGSNIVYRLTESCKHILPRQMLQNAGVDSLNETIHQYPTYIETLLALGYKNIRLKFVNAVEQEAKFDTLLAKTFLHTYGLPIGIIMMTRFILFKSSLKLGIRTLSCGQIIISATKVD